MPTYAEIYLLKMIEKLSEKHICQILPSSGQEGGLLGFLEKTTDCLSFSLD
jgi:hypothetical protein